MKIGGSKGVFDMDIDNVKENIALSVKLRMEEKELSIYKMAKLIDGVSSAQIHRVVCAENYTIDTLLKIFCFLDMDMNVELIESGV